ncbi:MAG: DUF1467 family protein [Alphaproteobacteria bacterium]
MTPVTGIVVFVIIWWLVLFTVLPWRARPPQDLPKGHAYGAPDKAMIGRKALITTAITVVLFAIVYLLIEFDVISFHRMASQLG